MPVPAVTRHHPAGPGRARRRGAEQEPPDPVRNREAPRCGRA